MPMFDKSNNQMNNDIYGGHNNAKKYLVPLVIHFAPQYMSRLIQYVVYPSKAIMRKNKRNLFKLLDKINVDLTYPSSDINSRIMFNFLYDLTDQVVNGGYTDYNILVQYFTEKIDTPDGYPLELLTQFMSLISESYENTVLFTDNDINRINTDISDKLKYSFIYQKASDYERLVEMLKNPNISAKELMNFATPLIEDSRSEIKKSSATSKEAKYDLTLGRSREEDRENSFETQTNIIRSLQSTSNKLASGFQGLNTMIDGGFEAGRTYMLLGIPKHFKSGSLLNICLSIMFNNPNYKPKDPTKIPSVIYFTQENTIKETYQRIYAYITGGNIANLGNVSTKEIVNTMEKSLSTSNFALKLRYRSSNTVDTSELESIYDEEMSSGYEPAVIVQDYIKRIRSEFRPNDDLRLTLGSIVDEFGIIAKDKEIPIISAAQLNREAYRLMEAYMEQNRPDVAKKFGASHVAESAQIIENADYAIAINREDMVKDPNMLKMPEVDEKNQTYLSFKLLASRSSNVDPDDTYFAQPFENGFKLVEDINDDKPAYTKSITEVLNNTLTPEEFQNLVSQGQEINQEYNFKKNATTFEKLDNRHNQKQSTGSILNNLNPNNKSSKDNKDSFDDIPW